ncbi:MAG: DUF3592 domain-containing protein [Oscillospiraceae bacterium]|nr:DUF3592 domain-containing protein [Oscillospiraceae bacterium]
MGKSRGFSIIIAILLLVAGGFIFISTSVTYATYETTQGEIDSVSTRRYKKSKSGSKTYRRITYSYKVNGISHSGSATTNQYVSDGESITVYYSQSDPSKSKTDDELFDNIKFSLGLGVGAVLFFIGPVKTGRKFKNASPY